MREFNLTLAQVANAIRESSVDISAGNVRTQGGDVLIRSKGQAYRRSDFEEIVVKTNPDGSIIRVGDVAVVQDGFEEDAVRTLFDGEYAAMVQVDRVVATKARWQIADGRQTVHRRQAGQPAGRL